MKIKTTLGGVTQKYFSSKLSAINYARKISLENANWHTSWSQSSTVVTRFEVITFSNGKVVSRIKLSNKSDDYFYY